MSRYWIEVRRGNKILIPHILINKLEYDIIRENMKYYSNSIERKIEKELNKNIYYECIKSNIMGIEFQLSKGEEVIIEIEKSEIFSGYKIKLSEFIQSKKPLAIHCVTLNDTLTILKALWRMGEATKLPGSEIERLYYSPKYTGNLCYTNMGIIMPLDDESCGEWHIECIYEAEEVDLEN